MTQATQPTTTETPKRIEAYGVRGMKSKHWKKTFKSQAAFEAWLDENEGDVQVHGTREAEAA